jgi:formylglycine-generating enzyme required for sulfatase activity
MGPESGESKCIRGGAWGYDDSFLRNSNRNRWNPNDYNDTIGFRVALMENS